MPDLVSQLAPFQALMPSTEKPTLVPLDVWLSYQQELQRQESVESGDASGDIITQENRANFRASFLPNIEMASMALSEVGLLEGVPHTALEELARRSRQGAVPAGEYLFREGERA